MEIFLRILLCIVKLVSLFVSLLGRSRSSQRNRESRLPQIEDGLLKLSIRELQHKLRAREICSVELIEAYIARIAAVNPLLNAVVEERFTAALAEAKNADELIKEHEALNELPALFARRPLIGLPMTVKESCALGGMSFEVGSLKRAGIKAGSDGTAVALLRAAGAIPLLVSANPEYCYSMETNTLTRGRCLNPYDFERTPGGSSGGEGALNGAGASLFGVGSDVGGSIRIPSLFCGVFGHKPTAGIVSAEGHFPNSNDAAFNQYLQIGPISRYACDLNILLAIMAGEKTKKLALDKPLDIKLIRVHYAYGFSGLNGCMHAAVDQDIQNAIRLAVTHFKSLLIPVVEAKFKGLQNSLEIALAGIARLENMPYLMEEINNENHKVWTTVKELFRSIGGKSKYTLNGLSFELMRRKNAYMSKDKMGKYAREAELLKEEITNLLGEDGVLFFPTFHVPAILHNTSTLELWGIDYTLLFNIIGLPVTHVPMGLGEKGLPIGFSVIAAPYQDRLCLRVAQELDESFGGWIAPNAESKTKAE